MGDARLTQDDIFSNNNRNAFIASRETLEASRSAGKLVFDCVWSEPSIERGQLEWRQFHRHAGFDELTTAPIRSWRSHDASPSEAGAPTREPLRAVQPLAIEAALEAERRHMEVQAEQRRIGELELQQARCEATLAERRYAACDPVVFCECARWPVSVAALARMSRN